jgi:predicted acylesterase/phospholipase RssA
MKGHDMERSIRLRTRKDLQQLAGLMAIVFLACVSACSPLPGHWRPGWNEHKPAETPIAETAASWKMTDLETLDGRFIGLAVSGGGSRAANFGAAVMLELQQRGLLSQVDVISGVSGGTLPAVYYGLGDKAGPFEAEAVRKTLGYDFQSNWLWRWLLPHNIFRFWFTDFTRSDIMVQVFNAHLTHKATFADLRLHPKILLNSTIHNDHTRFTFTDDRFASLHSNLATYRVANAVNASSAFPGAFDDVTLENYSPQDPVVLKALGVEQVKYFHLYDGGPIDNLGLQAIVEYLNRNVTGPRGAKAFPNSCLIFVVDATPASEHPEINLKQSSRHAIDYLINTNVLDATDTMLIESRRSTLVRSGIPPEKQDQDVRGHFSINDPSGCGCEIRHIALRHLVYMPESAEAPGLAYRATRINTKFWLSKEEQDDLFMAAKLLVKELDDDHLLPGPDSKSTCDRLDNAHN